MKLVKSNIKFLALEGAKRPLNARTPLAKIQNVVKEKMSFEANVDDGQTRTSDSRHPKITIAHHGQRGPIASREGLIRKHIANSDFFKGESGSPVSPLDQPMRVK